ncbi:hypothetical protein PSY31_23090, partial [Shigella flexneri]|nr:hypothetical protein [Shigella flexneri]
HRRVSEDQNCRNRRRKCSFRCKEEKHKAKLTSGEVIDSGVHSLYWHNLFGVEQMHDMIIFSAGAL